MKVKRLVFCLMLSVMLVVTFIPVSGFAVEAETDNDVIAEGLTDGTDEEGSLEEITFEGADEDDCLWSDGTVTYNVVLPDNVEGDFNLIVGVNDPTLTEWEPRFTEGVEYSFDDGTLTLYGDKIFEALGEEGDIAAYATITDADEGVLLAEGFASIFVQKASVDYSLPEDITEVAGMNVDLGGYIEADVYGAEHPFGEVVNCRIAGMKVIEQNPSGVVSLEKEDESWVCSMNKLGTAVIEVTYEDVYQEKQTCTFNVNVVKTKYEAVLYAEKDQHEGLPGDSLHLYANAYVSSVDEEVDEDPEFEYEWTITKGGEFAVIEQDADDSSKAVVTFNEDIEAGEDGYIYEEVTARVDVKVGGEKKASDEMWLVIRNEYNVLELDDPDLFNPDLGVGESMSITPVVHHFQVGQESYDVVEGAEFNINCSEEEFDVTEQDGTFTMERLEPWATEFYLSATLGSGEEVGRTFKLNRLDDDPSYDDDNEFVDPVDADAEPIEPGQEKHVNTEVKDGLFKFTAESDGKYVFYSRQVGSYCDPRGRVVDLELDEEDQVLADERDMFDNYLDLEDTYPDDFQIYFDAEAGHTYYLQAINCNGTGEFTVGLVKSDIESISYKHVRDPYPLREGIDTYTRMDDEGLTYWNVDWPEEGDELTITKTDGAATYQFKSLSDGTGSGDSDWAFVNKDNAEDVLPAMPRIEDIPVSGDEEVGDTLNVDLTYAGCKTEMQFKIFENPIQSIEPSTENITVDLVEDEDDGVDYVADWDDITFTVKTKDGDTNEYLFNAEEYDNHIYGGWMYCEEIDDSFHCLCGPWGYDEENDANWEVGGNYTTTLKTAGFTINLNVNVVKHEHQWGTYIEPATLDENGMQMQQCEICGESKEETEETIYHPDQYTFAKAVYTGEPVEPKLTITDTEGEEIDASNYDVEYSNNTEVGTASAVVMFKGDYYSGVKDDLTFEIEPSEEPSFDWFNVPRIEVDEEHDGSKEPYIYVGCTQEEYPYDDPIEVKGVSYDEDTNTLTLDNYKNANTYLGVHRLDDLNVVVKGDCVVATVDATAATSLHFKGDGSLTVKGFFGMASRLSGVEYADISLSIAPETSLHVSDSDGISIDTSQSDQNQAIQLNGRDAEITQEQKSIETGDGETVYYYEYVINGPVDIVGSWEQPDDPCAEGHTLTAKAEKPATCTEAGNNAYWECSKCGKYFSDEEGTVEIEKDSWVTAALGHDMTAHEEVDATCTEAGNNAYWKCNRCGKFFSDEEGTDEIEKDSWVIAALGHDMTAHKAVDATCTKEGNNAYWECNECGKYFSDEEGTKEIEKDSWVIEALGHDYKEEVPGTAEAATLTKDGKEADRKCSRCDDVETGKVIYRPDTESIQFATATYNGKAQMPKVTIKDINGDPIDSENFDVTYSNNVNAGVAAKAVITFKGARYSGTVDDLTFKINKANQRMTVKAATKTLKAKKLKKKAQTVTAITVARQGATPTYRKLSGSGKLTVNAKTGKITVKKKTKKGTYKVKVRVTSGATVNYNAAYRDVFVTVKVKK